MSERTEVSFDAALMMALRADAQKELDELPSPAQLKERYPDTSRWDARLQAALHKRRPVLKRVLIAVLTLVILTLGALAVSAEFRRAVYTMIQKFLPIEMQLTYQMDGEPLEQLPNGYSDHYVPDGFERDYAPLVERLHGQVIHISPSSTQYINPMDINTNYSEEDNPLALKADFILSLCELVVGGKEGLKPVEKTVIDRCVHKIYAPYFEHPCPETVPMLEDLYNALLTQDEPEAHHVAAALEIYVKGSLNIFNHRTNVDIDNRIVCYDIKQLGKQLKKLGMLIVQDQVWGRVTANRSVGKSTRYYADEFHLLLKDEQTAAYSVEIWKRFRKWGGIPTALTQNVKDLLASPEVSNIFENSDFVYMLNQANGDRQILAKQLNISPHQLSYVTHSGEGEGLLFFGNVILPFVDHFPKDLELYRILTTRLSEVVEAKHE